MGQARDLMDQLTEAAVSQKDLKALGELFADDAIAHTPDHGTLKGRAEIVEWWSQMIEMVPDAVYQSDYSYEMGNTAIDEGHFTGTNTGPITLPTGEKLPATNKRLRMRGCDFATVENGRIVEYRVYFDQMELMEQLGLTSS